MPAPSDRPMPPRKRGTDHVSGENVSVPYLTALMRSRVRGATFPVLGLQVRVLHVFLNAARRHRDLDALRAEDLMSSFPRARRFSSLNFAAFAAPFHLGPVCRRKRVPVFEEIASCSASTRCP